MNRLALALSLAALTACGSGDALRKKEAEAAKYQADLTTEQERSAALQTKLDASQTELQKAQTDLQASQARVQELEAAQQQLEAAKAELEKKSAEYEQLASSLKGEIDAGRVELTELKGKMTVKLKDKVVFGSGSAAINKQGQQALDAVAKAFQGLQGKTVIVAGYTDNVPTGSKGRFKDNWDLSTERAVSVVRYLQSKGVDPKMLGAAGFSEYRPLASNDTPDGRSQNRRIEIALTAADYTPPAVDAAKPAAPASPAAPAPAPAK